jgi:hypothetical protein
MDIDTPVVKEGTLWHESVKYPGSGQVDQAFRDRISRKAFY